MNRNTHRVSSLDGDRRASRLLHQVIHLGLQRPGRNLNPDIPFLSAPLIQPEDEGIAVLGFLHRRQDYILRVRSDEGVRGRQRASMCLDLHRLQLVVEFVSPAYRQRLLPVSTMWIKGIAEVVMATVGVGVRLGRRTKQRDPKRVTGSVIAVL